ncbi:MAG TPA: hypothetical protein PLK77_05735 [Pyrinomonadaceae bacterium]|nr:hypothetical protein [Pyrinomonadaceae bacterium]
MKRESPFACEITNLTPGEKARTFELLDIIKAAKREIRELSDGFAFRYAMSPELFRQIAEFITYEHRCCPFFEFNLTLEREGGDMWLTLTGRDGVKSFIREEFDLQ